MPRREPMPFILSQFIEAARWIGALVVLAVHTNNMYINLADIMTAPHAPPVYAWWFFAAFELGHQAVLGFFVMSGYLVGGAVVSHILKRQDFLREYFIHRVTRIYLVLVPAVIFTLMLDQIGRRAFADSGVYEWPMFDGHFSATLFFASLVNLQSIAFDYFGTNGPLWSLACEFWYYVTFPLLLLPLARNYSPALRFGGFALGLALLVALSIPPSFFKFGYILWAAGAFATLLPRPIIRSRWLALALYAVVVILIRFLVRGPNLLAWPRLMDISDFVASMLFIVVLVSFRFGPHEGFSLLRPKLHKTLADFSFSLYSIHLPMLIFMRAMVGHVFGRDWATQLATPQNYAAAFAAMAVTIVSGYGFSRLTEARTGAARRALRSLLDRIAPAAARPAE
ncbi:acyltransferase [Methylocystis sp. WRRC1]|uniref:acyltransferase family protein n=1 Tax=Methylocystis sp. WRRC1 TaxID=1732014 RepID=UPI001D15AED3|nr:acyltransferase [Methylocystis sp. WRRC1]MCC3246328.1 acyltransferase [Methylocystis sp. WRRC1]